MTISAARTIIPLCCGFAVVEHLDRSNEPQLRDEFIAVCGLPLLRGYLKVLLRPALVRVSPRDWELSPRSEHSCHFIKLCTLKFRATGMGIDLSRRQAKRQFYSGKEILNRRCARRLQGLLTVGIGYLVGDEDRIGLHDFAKHGPTFRFHGCAG